MQRFGRNFVHQNEVVQPWKDPKVERLLAQEYLHNCTSIM